MKLKIPKKLRKNLEEDGSGLNLKKKTKLSEH